MKINVNYEESLEWIVYKATIMITYLYFIRKKSIIIIDFIYKIILEFDFSKYFNEYYVEFIVTICISLLVLGLCIELISKIICSVIRICKSNIIPKVYLKDSKLKKIIEYMLYIINLITNLLGIGLICLVLCAAISINHNFFNNMLLNKVASDLSDSLSGSNFMRAINQSNVLYNGTLLKDAVKENKEIIKKAKSIVSKSDTDIEKAKKLYDWIGKNIEYDYNLVKDNGESNYDRGAIYAFNNLSGVCFEYATLYVVMARAVDLQVRLIIGDAYNGEITGRHAWNQVYIDNKKEWINVDSTFWGNNNAFNSSEFNENHFEDYIAGEW